MIIKKNLFAWLILGIAILLSDGKEANAYLCSSADIEVTTTPIPFQIPKRLNETRQMLRRIPTETEILLVGDSLLANWPRDMLHGQFSGKVVFNMAVGGAETQNVLWLLDQVPKDAMQPRQILVLIGTNNLSRKYLSPCSISQGISAVVKKASIMWPTAEIKLISVPPRGSDFLFRNKDRKELNRLAVLELHSVANLAIIDFDPARLTCGQYSEKSLSRRTSQEEPKTEKCENYADDKGHFTRKGYATIFSLLQDPKSVVPLPSVIDQ